MAPSIKNSASFSQALQFITSVKLQELEKQRLAYQAHTKVLDEANAAGDDLVRKVEILLKGVRSWSGSGVLDSRSTLGGKLNLWNLDLWLSQAKKDPSFSQDILRSWINIRKLTSGTRRCASNVLHSSAVFSTSGWQVETLPLLLSMVSVRMKYLRPS